jgi:signal transduction histidine kinase
MFPEIRFCYGGTDIAVTADALLPEVFTNLIGNAIKFGGAAVEVTIRGGEAAAARFRSLSRIPGREFPT